MKSSTVALITTAIVASVGIGFLLHFDNKRRTDPQFRKQLKREQKKAAKEQKKHKEEKLRTISTLIDDILVEVEMETFPESADEKESYFVENVAEGERLIKEGKSDDSILYFYKALKIYPAPLELVQIYQKTLPDEVFRIVVNVMAVEQHRRQTRFYDEFPPKETNVKLKAVTDKNGAKENNEAEKDYVLVADKDIKEGEVLFTEKPFISALYAHKEGLHCHYCMKKLDPENKIECINCDETSFCSKECETTATQLYHQFLCTNNKLEHNQKNVEFTNYTKTNRVVYPRMIAQFLSSMVAEEAEKSKLGKAAPKYGAWDHIERMRSGDGIQTSESCSDKTLLVKSVLASKVAGIEDFLTDEIYQLLLGKLHENAYEVYSENDAVTEEEYDKTSKEPGRIMESTANGLGRSLYKIAAYIQATKDQPNVAVKFSNNSNEISVIATKSISKGEEITTVY